MAQQAQQHSFLSVSCSNLESSENQLATLWGAFTKCKPYIENGTRLENMSWRLWQYQRQPTNYIDNTTIKRFITSVLLSPVNVHDAYSHEVAQPAQKCYTPTTTTTMAPAEPKSATFSFIVVDDKVNKADDLQAKEPHDDDDDEYEDDEDYYLSDDLYDDDLYDEDDQEEEHDHVDDVKANPSQIRKESQFNHDFRKMQPRPTTPRRSLLSDLLGRVSSPPSLLSNSTCSFTTNSSLTEDESSSSASSSSSSASTSSSTTTNTTKYNTNHSSKIASTTQHHPFTTNTDPSEIRWRESFHGW
ncbi:hypothetical protein V8B55DRAFT_1511522 [Mucor lusitanicus]|uniref:Nitrogen regulatory protein areA GATA-like domain-containing protein n=1 Tax=Mucor lusitanicus CBS 277.49 TaxID=747725 RepID=A0A168GUA4_MUCCL|nr:hypothetical protein MUCCIDRAFT_116115 [Mucor lusitanicus CBS 277.49]